MELLLEHLGRGLMLSLLLSLPAVLTAASIGLVVGILQAVTQVQEQTIAAAPKILGVFLCILLGGGMMMTMLENYVREAFQIAFNEVPQDGVFILPSRPSQHHLGVPYNPKNPAALKQLLFKNQAPGITPSNRIESLKKSGATISGEKDPAAPLEIRPERTRSGDALGLAEKMMLQRSKAGGN